jgi:hypothetical protein
VPGFRPGAFRDPAALRDGVRLLAGELAAAGGVKDSLDQQSDIDVVDAGDRVAEADRCPVGEAGRQEEDSAFPPELGSSPACRALTAASQSIAAVPVPW